MENGTELLAFFNQEMLDKYFFANGGTATVKKAEKPTMRF